jgi:aminocarboxymuconate-semialdehyde decarboxylase
MEIVDVQRHWTPDSYFDALVGNVGYPRAQRTGGGYRLLPNEEQAWDVTAQEFDLDDHLRELDRAGISTAVLSPGLIAIDALSRSAAQEMCELLNGEMSRAQQEHDGRIVGLAALPLRYPDLARKVIRDAISKLKLRGVFMPSNVGRRTLSEMASAEVFAEMDRLGTVCFLHPAPGLLDLPRYGLEPSLGFMFGTTIAACELVLSGIVTSYPRINFVHPHGGGTIPYLAGRLDTYAAEKRALVGDHAPVRPSEVLRQMFTDTASLTEQTLRIAIEFYGASRVMFGSDFPFFSPDSQLGLLCNELSGAERTAVLSGNAQGLFDTAV